MNKIPCYPFLLLAICICLSRPVAGQPTFTIDQTNIATGATITGDQTVPNSTCLLTLIGNMTVAATPGSGYFLLNGSATAVPVSLASVHLTSVGSVSLISGQPTVVLSSGAQTIYSALAALIKAQNFTTIDYHIPASGSMNTYAWSAGTYTTPMAFHTSGVLCSGDFSTSLNILVKPFITFTPPPVVFNITALSNYSSGITTNVSANAVYTVPLGIQVMANGGANFSYTNDRGYANPSVIAPVSTVAATPTLPAGSPAVAALNNTAFQNISPAGGVAVQAGNTQASTVGYSISAANLKNYFKQYGQYTVALKYNLYDPSTSTSYGTPTTTLTVNVPDLGSIATTASPVLNFQTAGDYSNGVSTAAQLNISKTTPYDVYVSASGTNLVNGSNTIPVSTISIGPGNGQSGVNAVTLSTTPQKIISGALPEIDRVVGINYAITAQNAATLIGKTPGTYNTTVTYSFTAP